MKLFSAIVMFFEFVGLAFGSEGVEYERSTK